MKDQDMRRLWGLTWHGWLNCLILQWLCLRLQRVVEEDGAISGCRVIWAPIWRVGWSLPSRDPCTPGYPGSGTPVSRLGVVSLYAGDDLSVGDIVHVAYDGRAYHSNAHTDTAVGTALNTANPGGVVAVRLHL